MPIPKCFFCGVGVNLSGSRTAISGPDAWQGCDVLVSGSSVAHTNCYQKQYHARKLRKASQHAILLE